MILPWKCLRPNYVSEKLLQDLVCEFRLNRVCFGPKTYSIHCFPNDSKILSCCVTSWPLSAKKSLIPTQLKIRYLLCLTTGQPTIIHPFVSGRTEGLTGYWFDQFMLCLAHVEHIWLNQFSVISNANLKRIRVQISSHEQFDTIWIGVMSILKITMVKISKINPFRDKLFRTKKCSKPGNGKFEKFVK